MAKNKSTLGKLVALATTAAAIGGVCYVFRDQIKESEAFQKTKDKLDSLREKVNEKFAKDDEDDFYFDDEFEDDFTDDVFSEDAKSNREYTSITINSKDENPEVEEDQTENDNADDVSQEEPDAIDQNDNETAEDASNNTSTDKDDMKEIFADISIPTISFGSSNESKNESSATSEPTEYENEGLSDVDEDPDVLEEQDRLDF